MKTKKKDSWMHFATVLIPCLFLMSVFYFCMEMTDAKYSGECGGSKNFRLAVSGAPGNKVVKVIAKWLSAV